MDAREEYWLEENPAVVFITALQDLNQPYSCTQWGDQGENGYPLIIEHDGTVFSWLHDSWNAYPTYAILDHNMTVRAKPWTYTNNSNTNSCDGNNNTMPGFSGGNSDDFIEYLLEECGSLCEGVTQGDINDDGMFNVQDLILLVNMILGTTAPDYATADMNQDGEINIQDIILVLNIILDM